MEARRWLAMTDLYTCVDENAFDVDLGSKVNSKPPQDKIINATKWATRSTLKRMRPVDSREKVTATSQLPCLEQYKRPAQVTLNTYSIEVMSP
jgi:hypothetical protein